MTKEQGREILAKITGGLTETDICSVMLTPKQTLSIAEYVEAIEKERDELRAAQPEQEPDNIAHPGDVEAHDNPEKTADVVRKAYNWQIGADGRLYGLVSGDMGYCATHIVLQPSDIHRLAASPTAPAGDAVREIRRKAFAEAAEIAEQVASAQDQEWRTDTALRVAHAIRSRAEG